MTDERIWWTVYLEDGTERHPHASHVGFNPLGPDRPEVVFYEEAGLETKDTLRLPHERRSISHLLGDRSTFRTCSDSIHYCSPGEWTERSR